MRILGLDIGARRTGVAFLDTETGIPLPLDTLVHSDGDALVSAVAQLAKDRGGGLVVIGLPLLPSGSEGEQARWTRGVAKKLTDAGLRVFPMDERYTTDRPSVAAYDRDAASACVLLSLYASRELNRPS